GGAPGSGGGTVAGDGGLARSGGFGNERGGTATVSRTLIADNEATGGLGAPGGNGGDALGGGAFNGRPSGLPPSPDQPADLTFVDCTIRDNRATGGAGGVAGNGDRKSTRLNSSHVAISYAVFCLKKKKTMRQKRNRRHCVPRNHR